MPKTELERKAWELQAYGMSEEALIEEREIGSWFPQSDEMYAFCILSDAQELITMGRMVEANQLINKAKFWLFKGRRERENQEVQAEEAA